MVKSRQLAIDASSPAIVPHNDHVRSPPPPVAAGPSSRMKNAVANESDHGWCPDAAQSTQFPPFPAALSNHYSFKRNQKD